VCVGSTHCTECAGRYLQSEAYSEIQLRNSHSATVDSLEREKHEQNFLYKVTEMTKKLEAVEVTNSLLGELALDINRHSRPF